MTQILFYIVDGGTAQHQLTRRIAETAVKHGHRVYIHHDDADAASELDAYLWQDPVTGFLPHALAGAEGDAEATPLVLGWGDDPGDHDDLLINLARQVPDFFARFERVAEPVTGDENTRREARQRWQFYRDRGFSVQNHRLGG